MQYELMRQDGFARRGRLVFARGNVETPAFMPVGTAATVKHVTPEEVRASGAEILLANTFHLMLRPGTEVISRHGDLHDFMQWHGPILTDSGGFQVFSLKMLRKIDERGVRFRSPFDGAEVFLGPEESMQVQEQLGSDIIMAFDECTPYPADHKTAAESMALSLRWAERCRRFHAEKPGSLFGIVQGGVHADLRLSCLRDLEAMDFPGYAIGGLAVGESKEEMRAMLRALAPRLPTERPRYLMGVGTPEDILDAVELGIDMFDCVLPTRNARHGWLFTFDGDVKIKQSRYRDDTAAVDAGCDCYTCQRFSRAYLRHLFQNQEPLGGRLMSLHNLHFFQQLMAGVRRSIERGDYADFAAEVRARREKGGNNDSRAPKKSSTVA